MTPNMLASVGIDRTHDITVSVWGKVTCDVIHEYALAQQPVCHLADIV